MADLGLVRDARFYEELGTFQDVQRLLDSQFVQEKLQGIKSVMAMAALGRDIGKNPSPKPLARSPTMMPRAQAIHSKRNSTPQLTHDLSPASSPHQLSTAGRQLGARLRTPHTPYPLSLIHI